MKKSRFTKALLRIEEVCLITEPLQEELESIKEKIVDLFVARINKLMDVWPCLKVDKYVQEIYWKTPHLSYVIRRAQPRLKRTIEISPRRFDYVCPQCEEKCKILIKSWTQYKDKNTWKGVCNVCEENNKRRNEESREKFLKTMEDERNTREEKLRILKFMPYKEYLQTEHWKSTSHRARVRAHFRCQLCNTNKEKLDVHHKTYVNRGQEYPSDLIVLCRACHERHHEIMAKGDGDKIDG